MSLLISSLLSLSLVAHSALKVTIDPGHGGEEKGAVHGGVIEADIALKVSAELFNRMRKDSEFDVKLLRHNNQTVSLEDRVNVAKNFDTDLFVSIHANANPNARAKGTEFYIQSQLPMDEETLHLAHSESLHQEDLHSKPMGDVESIVSDLKKSHRILKSYQLSSYMRKNWSEKKKRMIRQGPFFVLSQNEAPAVLVELGYLSNPSERRRLQQTTYQKYLAEKIYRSLKDYAKNMDKLPTGILKAQNAKTR